MERKKRQVSVVPVAGGTKENHQGVRCADASARATGRRRRAVLDVAVTPVYETDQPNDPRCDLFATKRAPSGRCPDLLPRHVRSDP
jgi:hypothetical protein